MYTHFDISTVKTSTLQKSTIYFARYIRIFKVDGFLSWKLRDITKEIVKKRQNSPIISRGRTEKKP